MLRIAFSTLATRKSGTFGALAAVGLAVVLIVSCGVLLESSLGVPIPVERLQAASVVVAGEAEIKPASGEAQVPALLGERARVSAQLAGSILRVPGVARVVADRSVYAQLVDSRGRVLERHDGVTSVGHGWSSAALTPYKLASGHAPQGSTEVVVDTQLAARGALHLGDRVRILTRTAPQTFTVAGTASARPGAGPSAEAPLFFRDDVAKRLGDTGNRVDLLGVLTRPGADSEAVADRIRDALHHPDLRVLTGPKRGDAESPDAALSREDIIAGLTVFGVLAAFIAIFVVASAFALSVQQRHRELALFRAIGSTPRQVRRMVAGEALLVSLLAFVVAAPIAVGVAFLERGVFGRAGLVPQGLHLTIGWLPFVGGLLAAMMTTQLAAFASARRASRIRPTDALRESNGPASSRLLVQRAPRRWHARGRRCGPGGSRAELERRRRE